MPSRRDFLKWSAFASFIPFVGKSRLELPKDLVKPEPIQLEAKPARGLVTVYGQNTDEVAKATARLLGAELVRINRVDYSHDEVERLFWKTFPGKMIVIAYHGATRTVDQIKMPIPFWLMLRSTIVAEAGHKIVVKKNRFGSLRDSYYRCLRQMKIRDKQCE